MNSNANQQKQLRNALPPLCSTSVHVCEACNTFTGKKSLHTPVRQKYIKVAALLECSYTRSAPKHCTFTTAALQKHSASLHLHCTFTALTLHNGCKRPKKLGSMAVQPACGSC